MRAAVIEARERRQWRAGGMGDRLRVLVRLGDEGTASAMLPVVQALANSDLATDVLVVAVSPTIGRRAESLSTRQVRVLATTRRADLPRLIADHDLVVTRPGPIMWELCCIGTPVALVPMTADEEAAAAHWVAADVALNLGRPAGDFRPAGQLRSLLRDGLRRAQMGTNGLHLVDGEGATRVARLIELVAARPPR
jgi:spore coat polysaccharide biosynthesis predicted glycosyltransferase SpsG